LLQTSASIVKPTKRTMMNHFRPAPLLSSAELHSCFTRQNTGTESVTKKRILNKAGCPAAPAEGADHGLEFLRIAFWR
jgi:hypothetical protein